MMQNEYNLQGYMDVAFASASPITLTLINENKERGE
jgi:hypothetical protein